MWRTLLSYSKPELCYQLTNRLRSWIMPIALVLITIGSIGGLFIAPPDKVQGDSFRIIYFHVPAAILSMSIYVSMAISAAIGFIWRFKLANWFAISVAATGACFTFIALITGAIWGKPTWGTWWVWDARLTSELILLFLYIGVISLYYAFEDPKIASKASGILAIVGVVNVPIIHYSVIWWNTLHQGATITKLEKPSIAPEMLWPLLVNIVGFACFAAAVALISFGNEILKQEKYRPWVKQLTQSCYTTDQSSNKTHSQQKAS